MSSITSFTMCVSQQERKRQGWTIFLNVVLWLVLLCTVWGIIGALFAWLMRALLAEYVVRQIQARGLRVSEQQFPVVHEAAQQVYQCFNVQKPITIIVLASGEANAMALHIARKRVIILLSSLLDGVIDHPEELRALLAHEACHIELGTGWRGIFELFKPAPFSQGRELTCDNAGLVAAGDLTAAKQLIKKLCVGRFLFERVSEPALIEEARYIYSGLAGWLIKQYLSHPPAGARLENLETFAREQQISLPTPTPSLLA